MFSYGDYNNDRTEIRNRFMKQMHKKTTLKDIGADLDEMVLMSKAKKTQEHYDPRFDRDLEVNVAKEDFTSHDFSWLRSMDLDNDPREPLFMD